MAARWRCENQGRAPRPLLANPDGASEPRAASPASAGCVNGTAKAAEAAPHAGFSIGGPASATRSGIAASLGKAAISIIVGAAISAARTGPPQANTVRRALLRTIVALAGGPI